MFCGTLAAKGGIRPGKTFRMELEDPVLKRKLRHEYAVKVSAGRRVSNSCLSRSWRRAGALFLEVLWFRALGRALGDTVWSAALVLTAFMLGIALGALLVSRWRMRNPARAFAFAELTVALGGSLLVWGLPAAESAIGEWLSPLADHSATVAVLRLLLALAAMLVPTIAMGTTLALGVRIWAHMDTRKALGLLYAAYTLGACVAPLLPEFYLIQALGLRGTALVAAGLNALAALSVPPFPQQRRKVPTPASSAAMRRRASCSLRRWRGRSPWASR